MKIAFDLDDTLTFTGDNLDFEPEPSFPFSYFFPEKLRRGSVELISKLKRNGHEIFLYTSSLRSTQYLFFWFLSYGIHFKKIINNAVHLEKMAELKIEHFPTKFPTAFSIDVLIDNCDGVAQEGHKFNFKVIKIDPLDKKWVTKILDEVQLLQTN